jgi:hypothetical protein
VDQPRSRLRGAPVPGAIGVDRGRRPVLVRGDGVALAVGLLLVAAAALVGRVLNARSVEIVLPWPPLIAYWSPHLGWGTPLVVGCLLVGLQLQRRAAVLPWRRLLLAGWLLGLAWLGSLTLVDGLGPGWTDVLENPNEYLHDLPRITDPVTFLATFTRYIAFGPAVPEDLVWTTHVAGHPPLATLTFWALDRIGLGGGFWAGALCIVVASAAVVAVPVTLRAIGAAAAARRVVPLVALFPGAVWMAVSADGLFAGVATGGLALFCIGLRRGSIWSSLAGGLLLGASVYLSYGLVLFGVVVATAAVLALRRNDGGSSIQRRFGRMLIAVAGALGVGAVHTLLGFWWFDGLRELRVRYYQGIAATRPYAYFVWANLAAWLMAVSPVLAIGTARAVAALQSRGAAGVEKDPDRSVALLALSGVSAALIATLSGLSKGEVERIWLAFGLIAYTAVGLLQGQQARIALVATSGWAIAVNHLLDTGW